MVCGYLRVEKRFFEKPTQLVFVRFIWFGDLHQTQVFEKAELDGFWGFHEFYLSYQNEHC